MIMNLVIDLVLFGFVILILYLLAWGAVYVPTHQDKVRKIIELAKVTPGDLAVDLGSGDGRILIALAKAGAIAHGYEINPILVWWSRRKIKQAGLVDKAFAHWRSFWGIDLAEFNIVVLFGIDYIMRRLQKKLEQELATGSRVISFAFPFPDWQFTVKQEGIYVYEKK